MNTKAELNLAFDLVDKVCTLVSFEDHLWTIANALRVGIAKELNQEWNLGTLRTKARREPVDEFVTKMMRAS